MLTRLAFIKYNIESAIQRKSQKGRHLHETNLWHEPER